MTLKLFLYSAQIICSYILGSLDSLNSEVVAQKKHSPKHEPLANFALFIYFSGS